MYSTWYCTVQYHHSNYHTVCTGTSSSSLVVVVQLIKTTITMYLLLLVGTWYGIWNQRYLLVGSTRYVPVPLPYIHTSIIIPPVVRGERDQQAAPQNQMGAHFY